MLVSIFLAAQWVGFGIATTWLPGLPVVAAILTAAAVAWLIHPKISAPVLITAIDPLPRTASLPEPTPVADVIEAPKIEPSPEPVIKEPTTKKAPAKKTATKKVAAKKAAAEKPPTPRLRAPRTRTRRDTRNDQSSKIRKG